MSRLDALIAGSTGYIGIQLVKLLSKHKYINIKYLCGNNSAGKKITFYDKTLRNKKLPKIVNNGTLEATFGGFWGFLGLLGASWGASWGILGHLGGVLEESWGSLGRHGASLASKTFQLS